MDGHHGGYHATRSCSLIISSLIGVVLYFINFAVTGFLLGFFIYVFYNTESDDGSCFLFSSLNESTSLCDGSIVIISFLLLMEIVLVFLGAASIVSGVRSFCPKSLELLIVLLCVLLGTVVSLYIALGTNVEGEKCGSVCEKHQFHLYISSWLMVIIFFVAFIVQFADCVFHLPSRRNANITRSTRHYTENDHWYDERILLRNTEARTTYS